METNETMYERCCKVMPPVAGRYTTLGVVKGEGSYLYGEDGKKYLDFASGVAVCNLGHNHPAVVKAAKEQIDKLIHAGHNVVYYESYVELAEKLVELTGGDTMVYFSNSGAEANEGALKLAKYVTKRPAVISFKGSFHGRTMATAAITGSNSAYRKNYEPMVPSTYFLEYPNLFRSPYTNDGIHCPQQYFDQFDSLFSQLVDPSMVAAIIMEPIQGEGGYIVPPVEFVQYVRNICDTYGIMLIFDEVQTGFGRTGKMFAYEHFGVKPDIMSTAKALGAGFPLSAVIAKKEIMEQWPSGAHGGTFGGNPVSCAAGLASIGVLEDGALANASSMGIYFKEQLLELQKKHSCIGDVRGIGLMLAIELVKEGNAPDTALCAETMHKAVDEGLILLKCGTYSNVLRFIAPCIVTKEQIDFCISVLDKLLP